MKHDHTQYILTDHFSPIKANTSSMSSKGEREAVEERELAGICFLSCHDIE